MIILNRDAYIWKIATWNINRYNKFPFLFIAIFPLKENYIFSLMFPFPYRDLFPDYNIPFYLIARVSLARAVG